ncbi:MAG: histidine kinase dimerization/phospho-acceptor domain-containing protein [Ilumatobacteraceae bacterium]
MRREVEAISAGDLSARVTPPTTDHEISRLGATLNGLLGRLEASADQQQLFAASASHELRSPLSAIRTEMEVALAYPAATDWPACGQDVLVEVGRLERLARDLRVLTGRHSVDERASCDLAELITQEVRRHRHSAPQCRRPGTGDGGDRS